MRPRAKPPRERFLDMSNPSVELPTMHVYLLSSSTKGGVDVDFHEKVPCQKVIFFLENESFSMTTGELSNPHKKLRKFFPDSDRPYEPQTIEEKDYRFLLNALRAFAIKIHIPTTIPKSVHDLIIKEMLPWSEEHRSYSALEVKRVEAVCREIDYNAVISEDRQRQHHHENRVISFSDIQRTMRAFLSGDDEFITVNQDFWSGKPSNLTGPDLVEAINRRYQCVAFKDCPSPQTTKIHGFSPAATPELTTLNRGLITTLKPEGGNSNSLSPLASLVSLIPIFLIFLFIYKRFVKPKKGHRKKKGTARSKKQEQATKHSMPLVITHPVSEQPSPLDGFQRFHIQQITSLLEALKNFLEHRSNLCNEKPYKDLLCDVTQYHGRFKHDDIHAAGECSERLEAFQKALESTQKGDRVGSDTCGEFLLLMAVDGLIKHCSLLMPDVVNHEQREPQEERLMRWLDTKLKEFKNKPLSEDQNQQRCLEDLRNCLDEGLRALRENNKEDIVGERGRSQSRRESLSQSLFSDNSSSPNLVEEDVNNSLLAVNAQAHSSPDRSLRS